MLVGQGATDFAFEQGMPVLPHDALISPAARERWAKWSHDLKHADKRARRQQASNHAPTPIEPPPGYEQLATKPGQPDQDKSLATGVWNEGQPVSPPSSTPVTPSNPAVAHLAHPLASSGSSPISRTSSSSSHLTKATPATSASDAEGSPLQPLTAANLARNHRMRTREEQSYESSTTYRPDTDPQDASRDLEVYFATRYPQANSNSSEIDDGEDMDLDDSEAQYEQNGHQPNACGDAYHDVRSMTDEEDGAESSGSTLKLPSLSPSPPPPNPLHSATTVAKVEHQACREDTSRYHFQNVKESSADSAGPSCKPASGGHNAGVQSQDPDLITDTVGAIAIDSEGNVAAGASSGGIGMKFRGRVGPAALVGVGAAVTPPDGEDRTKTCTAAVTSGTGEHMGTTLAASTCAERLYTNRRKRKGGGYEPCEDDQAVRGMIEHDFMGKMVQTDSFHQPSNTDSRTEHPSVKQSHSAGAIGVLAVKRTAHGAYLYFAHNTDSFALASMSADDPKPTCTMSRSHGNGMLAQGGRAIRYKKKW